MRPLLDETRSPKQNKRVRSEVLTRVPASDRNALDAARMWRRMAVTATLNPHRRVWRDVIKSLTCPICRKELPPGAALESRWFPFCGERCRNVDLYRWSKGRYAIVEPLTPERLADQPDDALEDWPGDPANSQ